MIIREIRESDFARLVELFKDFALFEKQSDKMTNNAERMREEKELLKGFVAETDEEKIVAYVTCYFAYYTWSGKALYMDDLYVTPSHRGSGLGTVLINKVIEFAKESKCHKLCWQVSSWNAPAIGFYKKLGASINEEKYNCDLAL